MQDQKYTVESRRFPGWMWMDVCEDSLLQERKPSELRRGNPAPLSTIHPPIRLSQSIRQILIADREKKKKKISTLGTITIIVPTCPDAAVPLGKRPSSIVIRWSEESSTLLSPTHYAVSHMRP